MNKRFNKWCLSLFILLSGYIYADGSAVTAESSAITAEAAFSKSEITIGEKVKYTLTITAPKDTKVVFPLIDPVITGAGFAIKDFGEEKPVKVSKNKIKIKYWYILDTYVTGSYNIPVAVIDYTLSGGEKGRAETKDVFLEVKSVIKEGEKAEDIKDIKLPVDIKISYKKLILRGIAILLLISAGGFLFWYLKYKRTAKSAEVPLPAHVIALRDLIDAKKMSLNTEEAVKEYYVRVSGIVRHYIEDRFGFKAPEMTTEEFLNGLTGKEILNKIHKGLLRDFLRHCDMVKFAKYGPTSEEAEGIYLTAKKFIEETIPKINNEGTGENRRNNANSFWEKTEKY
jgi:hypothetical protein